MKGAVLSGSGATRIASVYLNSRRSGIIAFFVSGYVAALPYQFPVGNNFNFAPSDVFLLALCFFGMCHLKYRPQVWTSWHLGVVLTFTVGSLVCAVNYGGLATYELVNKDGGLALAFLSYVAVTSAVNEWSDLRRLLRIFLLSVVFENIVALSSYLAAHVVGASTTFAQYQGVRLCGTLIDPNAYGGLVAVALVACEVASSGRDPLLRWSTLLVARGTLMLGLLLTFSRSAWIGFGLAMIPLFVLRVSVAARILRSALFGAPVALFAMGNGFLPVVQDMASRPKQVQERFDLIHAAFDSFSHHPFIGGGLGSFRLTIGEIAHNSAMWFLADFGAIGLVVFAGFIGWFVRVGWVSCRCAPDRERPLVLALLLAHTAMFGLAMGIEAFYQRHWWLVFALIASGYRLSCFGKLQQKRASLSGNCLQA